MFQKKKKFFLNFPDRETKFPQKLAYFTTRKIKFPRKFRPLKEPFWYHGVIILTRSNNSVFLYLNIYWKRQVLWSHPRLENLNETQNFSSPGFFLKILNSVYQKINMVLDHKLFLQLFVIVFCLFCSRIGKR